MLHAPAKKKKSLLAKNLPSNPPPLSQTSLLLKSYGVSEISFYSGMGSQEVPSEKETPVGLLQRAALHPSSHFPELHALLSLIRIT